MTFEGRRRPMQARLALGMTALALGVAALVAVGGFLLASHLGPDPVSRTETRLEQIGGQVAVVQIEHDVGGAAAVQDARSNALRWVLAALAAAFIPAAGVAWLVAGRLLRPVRRLTEVVDQVDGSAAPERTGVERADELGALAEGVDRMLDRLDDRKAEQERRLHEVIHELRTPLAVVTTNLELARSSPAVDGDALARLGAAQRAVERMARTVDDFANHGRLALGNGGDARLDLAGAGAALAAEHVATARLRGIRLTTMGPERIVVPGDRGALQIAASNLVANALRLAPAGSTVTVGWGMHGAWGWLAVRDEGPGIARADERLVFERYWRGRYDRDRAGATTSNGNGHTSARGLGLTIARQAVEAQGGRITLHTEEGVGSTFVIWLPASADAEVAAVVADDGLHALVDPFAPATA